MKYIKLVEVLNTLAPCVRIPVRLFTSSLVVLLLRGDASAHRIVNKF